MIICIEGNRLTLLVGPMIVDMKVSLLIWMMKICSCSHFIPWVPT